MRVSPLVVKELVCRSSITTQKSYLITGFLDRLRVLRMRFKKKLLQRLDQGYVEPVEPDDRFPRVVRVIVPAKLRSQDQIALFHHALLSINRCVGAVPLENKAQRSSSVSVRPSVLSRLDVLE